MKYLISLGILLAAFAAQADNAIDEKVNAALAAESRPQADADRDKNRKPLETLNYFGLKDDMRVLELFPGGGWYTRVLGPVLAENGELIVGLGTGYVSENIVGTPGFENVNVLDIDSSLSRPEGSRFYVMDPFEFDVADLDMVLTFRNIHNFGPETRMMVNEQVYKALRNGGLYGVVDHTRRHMEAPDGENRRRIDPVQVIKEMLDVGFEFVGYSDLHFRADDELEYEVGRRSVRGNTDRFTFLFRKP